MKLKRKHARLLIVMLAAVACLLLVVWVLETAGVWIHPYLMIAVACILVSLLFCWMFLAWRLLRCPNCGKSAARAYWKPGKDHKQFCPRCGKPFIYDDEPDDLNEP